MLRLSSPETQRARLAIGISWLLIAVACYKTGHDRIAGMAVGFAAPLLLRPSQTSAERLDFRPAARLTAALLLTGVGAGAEYIAPRTGHVWIGTAVNAAANIYANHFVPLADLCQILPRLKGKMGMGLSQPE